MLLIGLTGSLATGKSTVSRILSSPPYSLPIIDADLLARQVVEPGTLGYRRIVAHFGPTTPDLLLPPPSDDDDDKSKGEGKGKGKDKGKGRPINRAVLGRRVFGDSSERQRDRKVLNSIVHPLVRLAMARAILYYYIRLHRAVVLDIPLLYESGLDIFCSVVIMVAVSSPSVQLQRLRMRDKSLSEEEARARVGSQMGVGEKVGRTRGRGRGRGWVVWNDGDKGILEGEVGRVVREIEGRMGGWWWGLVWGNPVVVVWVAVWCVWVGWRGRRRWEGERGRERAKL
ncbi:hypothetical protein JMJ35_007221 [Cladonia borealis]|uniref:Dephospho-CoA kinase n=1 Tax=Cladonia borealis TaxID=184061 RepID=A0AA39QYT1_9LECA|nr:hypothetical protein JMJ35_007221 [Cladonia borealis]